MNSYKRLVNNSLIFAVGNFGSKVISLLLVPLYTYYLTTTEYGIVDLVLTSIGMLLPIVTLSIYESVLRFTMENSESTNYSAKVFTNSLFITIVGNLVFIPIFLIFTVEKIDSIEYKYFIIILILQSFQFLLSQFARAIGEVKLFALNGILMTLIISISNIILLIFFKRGISGYFESLVLSNFISILFFCYFLKLRRHIDFKLISIVFCREMLRFSIPLIPNALIWWVINASNRYFILYYSTPVDNGLYAVANKLPTILTVVYSIFFQAWQLSAIEEFDKDKDRTFYNNVYNTFISVTFLITSFVVLITQPLFKLVISNDFYSSWSAVPFLTLGVVYSGFANFLGMFYIAAKETKNILMTSILSAIISILANLFLIPNFGFVGAAISTMISFYIMWIVRSVSLKSILELNVKKSLHFYQLIVFIQIGLLFYLNDYKISIYIQFILVIIISTLFIFENRKIIKELFFKIKQKRT